MSRFFRKLLSIRSVFRKRSSGPDEITEELWTADFSKAKTSHFDIKSESSYDANLQKSGARYCLSLGLKKTGCIAWVEAPGYSYRDQIIKARIRIDAKGGYGAAGIMFRVVDGETYYSFLISSKGYFRLDVSRNGMPHSLIGWTELPGRAMSEMAVERAAEFTIAAYGSHILILIKDEWVAEINDSSIIEGSVCFTAASYENTKDSAVNEEGQAQAAQAMLFSPLPGGGSPYTAETFLESLEIDSRIDEVSALYEKWSDSPNIDPRCRFRLAETFTAMNQHRAAFLQITRAWETPGYKREQKELLLGGRLALQLGMTADAEKYISACFEENVDSPEGKEALTEMAKILYELERYAELKDYCNEAVKLRPGDPLLLVFQGHAFWNLKKYKPAADAYDAAFEVCGKTNGIFAKNAANVYEVLGKKKEALDRYTEAGRAFLAADNYSDLGLLVPKLLALGEDGRDAHSLAGKWAFGIEDWDMARLELEKARALEKKKRRLRKDAALPYLLALLLVREGRRAAALPLFEEAAALEKDYALFSFKLAENRYLLNGDPYDEQLSADLERAIKAAPNDGWINNFAAELCLKRRDLEKAASYIENAAAVLGEVPAVRINRAWLYSRRGKLDEALRNLAAGEADDLDGLLANCAGNLLLEAGRCEEAAGKYRLALKSGENNEYLFNLASCLIELDSYGEADTILAKLLDVSPSPGVLELISYVAYKKGEYARAETACRSALEMNPRHVPSLLSLGWILAGSSRFAEGEKILARLEEAASGKDALARLEELRLHYENLLYTKINCASCGRNWKVLKEPPPVEGMRLFAVPPDELPAGSCPECGKTFCIGCAKERLDSSGRFICPGCDKPLKLINEGLKKIVYDWSVEHGPAGKGAPSASKSKNTEKGSTRGKTRSKKNLAEPAELKGEDKAPPKTRRGKPSGSKNREDLNGQKTAPENS